MSLVGLGANDVPQGDTPFGANGMTYIGTCGDLCQYGGLSTIAQLIGAVGYDQPEDSLLPTSGIQWFGTDLLSVGHVLNEYPWGPGQLSGIPADAPYATFAIVAWDNFTGLYPTWNKAYEAWMAGLIAAGRSPRFTVAAIGGGTNVPPYLNNL